MDHKQRPLGTTHISKRDYMLRKVSKKGKITNTSLYHQADSQLLENKYRQFRTEQKAGVIRIETPTTRNPFQLKALYQKRISREQNDNKMAHHKYIYVTTGIRETNT